MRYNTPFSGTDDFFKELRRCLPPVFTRETASKMIGGIFAPRTLSNLDAEGKGPSKKRHVGKKVVYERDDFVDWLERQFHYQRHVGRSEIPSGY